MYEDDIKKVDEWFAKHTVNYGTYHCNDEYSVGERDLLEFADFLNKEFPDMCGIKCMFGLDESVIWFFKRDLEEVLFL